MNGSSYRYHALAPAPILAPDSIVMPRPSIHPLVLAPPPARPNSAAVRLISFESSYKFLMLSSSSGKAIYCEIRSICNIRTPTIEFSPSLSAPYSTFILFLYYNVNTYLIDIKL